MVMQSKWCPGTARFGVGLHVIDVADDATIAQLLVHLQHRIVDVRQHHLPLLADHAGERPPVAEVPPANPARAARGARRCSQW